MSTSLAGGRRCLPQLFLRGSKSPSILRCQTSRRALSTFNFHFHSSFRSSKYRPNPRHAFLFASGSTLVPAAAFISLSQQSSSDASPLDGSSNHDNDSPPPPTSEERMLSASRHEQAKSVPSWLENSTRIRRTVWQFLDSWIVEPVATGLRLLHLAVIFVPVIVAVPAVWVGRRVKDRDNERSGTLWWYGMLVRGMERAGSAFIKLGQWAASRTDIFPTELCIILSSLHSDAPAHPLSATKAIVERAFDNRPFATIFSSFDPEPLGVGAIAQVYKAKLSHDLAVPTDADVPAAPDTIREILRRNVDFALKSTPARVPSRYVAVKVLHPGVQRTVERDLRLMAFFANLLNVLPGMQWLSLPDEVRTFAGMMRLQLDLRIEAANLTQFRRNFRDRTTAWFPFPYAEYSTRNVLVEEFATGIPLREFLENGGGPFQKDLADEGLDAFLHMVLIDNFVHADLHPGNIMVRFYRPGTVDVASPLLKHRRKAEPHHKEARSVGATTAGAAQDQRGTQADDDVTEEVLSRLRPLRSQPKAWAAQLQKLDEEGYRPQIIFIDTGLVTELNTHNRANFLDLFRAVAEFDGYRAGQLMVSRSRQPETVVEPEVFALRMQHLVLGVKSRTFALGNVDIGGVLGEVMSMVRAHHVRLEGDFVNVVLSILLLEGIGRRLDPELDLFAGALPILRQLGTKSGTAMLRGGDFSMLKVWAGLEARSFLQASIESVERCVKYDLLSPNV